MKTLRTVMLGAVTALALSSVAPAFADNFAFSFDTGNVAFAYRDGYWDNNHHWHKWHNTREAHAYRDQFHDHYSDWKHNRDHDMGWKR